jgi:AhpD family alkylhydroperoxidase
MKARMTHPVTLRPAAMDALNAFHKASRSGPVPAMTHHLLQLRVSQLNGCSWCVDMHSRELKADGASEEKIWAVGAWRESPHFDDAERAALDLAEHVTRLADRPDPVPDPVWNAVANQYDEEGLASLLLTIAGINVWNRLNVAIQQPAGAGG